MSTPALVSCVVPVYNGETYLAETLDSILRQSYSPLEVIVVDDGSTDGTAAVLESYAERVHTLRQPNLGPGVARALGIRSATGEMVGLLDADDLWHPEKLSRQMARFAARPELGVSVTLIQNFWMSEVAEEGRRYQNIRRGGPIPGYSFSTLLARRTAFELIGPPDVRLRHSAAADWILRAEAADVKTELLPQVLAQRRMHSRNLSRTEPTTSLNEFFDLIRQRLNQSRGGATSSASGATESAG